MLKDFSLVGVRKMPIDVNEWNSGRIVYPLKERILFFLRNYPDKAFDIQEIIEGTGYSVTVVMMGYGKAPEIRFRRTLESLMEEGSVEIRAIRKTSGEELYYKAVK